MRQVISPHMFGRHEEIAAIEQALEDAREGQGGTMFITGDAGVGKSRLALHAGARAQSQGFRVTRGRASPSTSAFPFRPFAEALISTLRGTDASERSKLGPYGSALGRLVPEWSTADEATNAQSLLVVQEAAVRLLRLWGASQPTLIILEDLHWADPETLGLVEYFADNLASEPAMCVCTLRSDEESDALALTRRMRSRRRLTQIALGRLRTVEVIDMARACLDVAELPAELYELLEVRAEGVPFLVEEVLASCIASGRLVSEQSAWRLLEGAGRLVPDTVRGLVGERLGQLDSEAREVVTAAAVLGRQFDWTVIPALLALPGHVVLSAVRRAVDAQLISPNDPGERFRFRHALTRDAVLEALLPPERARLAQHAAETLEAAHPGLPGEWCERVAELYAEAGQGSRAAALFLESGRRAQARGALGSAEAASRRARDLVGADADLALSVDEQLVAVLSLAGKADLAIETGERLIDALRDAEAPPSRQASIQLATGRAEAAAGRWESASARLRDAACLVKAAGNEALLASILAAQAQAEVWRGEHAEAARLARDALELAERADAAVAACEALDVLGRQAQNRQRFDEALAIFARAVRVADHAALLPWRTRALLEAGTVEWLMSGRTEALVEARELAESSGAVWTLASAEQNLSWAHLFGARLDDLEEANTRCLDLCRRFNLGLLPHALVVTAALRTLQGREQKARAALQEACTLTDDLNVHAAACGWVGTAALLREDRREAAAAFEEAMTDVRRSGLRSGMWMNWHFIGTRTLLLEVDDPAAGARIELRSAPMARACWNEAALAYGDAVAAGRSGRRDEAEAAFARAESLISWAPLLRELYRRLAAEAAVADGWGAPGDWLASVLPFFGRLGLEQAASASRGLLRKAGAPVPRRPRARPGVPKELRALGVTSREMDVLRVLAEGWSNPEIGRRLYLSTRTVESHVASLLRRTGAANRGQLITLASRVLSSTEPSVLA